MKNGFFRVAACVPPVTVADPGANAEGIVDMARRVDELGVELAVFPELCVTGYTCGDLFHNSELLGAARAAVDTICAETRELDTALVVGTPMLMANRLYNCAVVIYKGAVKCRVAKSYIPDYNEFYERRMFTHGTVGDDMSTIYETPLSNRLFNINGVTVGIEICEDLWVPIPPSCHAAMAGATVIANLSASPDQVGKLDYLKDLVASQSARCRCAYIYASAGFGESSTDLVFDGKAIIAENGRILACNKRWQNGAQFVVQDIDIDLLCHDRLHTGTFADCARRENLDPFKIDAAAELELSDLMNMESPDELRDRLRHLAQSTGKNRKGPELIRTVDRHPFVPGDDTEIDRRADEIINIQVAGLAQRLSSTRTRNVVLGISGGLDSTLALLVTCRAFDRMGLSRKGITAITMPGFGTTGRTHSNAVKLMEALGVTIREIPIGPAVERHFADIGHDPSVHDVTYENSQARERTQILMDVANQTGGMVIGTGDLSELALGWATYNGDQMSMYGVNASVPKTLVRYLVRWFAFRAENPDMAEALVDIIDTPISPELLPANPDGEIAQVTEDLVGPYELHDFFLYHLLRNGEGPRRIYMLARAAFGDDYAPDVIRHWLKTFFRRFFNQQFKRSCMPDGPKVGSVCLSPRGDWRMPSDASSALWLREIDRLDQPDDPDDPD